MRALLSHDLPRSRILGGLLLLCFVGALLVGLMANYTGYLAPKVALFSNIALMVAVLLWRPQGLYQQNVTPQIGAQVNVLIFIVIIIGGLGSTGGALIGALLVGLMANYTGFLVPKLALFSNIALMAAVLLWRPQGVYPVVNR